MKPEFFPRIFEKYSNIKFILKIRWFDLHEFNVGEIY
jgi:hypothetical protein